MMNNLSSTNISCPVVCLYNISAETWNTDWIVGGACYACIEYPDNISTDLVNYLNLTQLGFEGYFQAYCANPPSNDTCPFGYCPNPDAADEEFFFWDTLSRLEFKCI